MLQVGHSRTGADYHKTFVDEPLCRRLSVYVILVVWYQICTRLCSKVEVLFSYPGTSDKPHGKLRQLFEVIPFAFIYEQAGGQAIDNKGNKTHGS